MTQENRGPTTMTRKRKKDSQEDARPEYRLTPEELARCRMIAATTAEFVKMYYRARELGKGPEAGAELAFADAFIEAQDERRRREGVANLSSQSG